MTTLWQDGFDHYGVGAAGRANMLNGPWAEITEPFSVTPYKAGPIVPTFNARTGEACLIVESFQNNDSIARRVLGGSFTTFLVSMGFRVEKLPSNSATSHRIITFCDGANNPLFSLTLSTTGDVVFRSGETGASIVSTLAPVIQAGVWHHLEMKIVINAVTGSFELRVDEHAPSAIVATGLNTGATPIQQIRHTTRQVGASVEPDLYIDDLILRDATGTYNNGFQGDLRIATLFPNGDTTVAGWTPHYRKKFGTGILDLTVATDNAVSAAQSTQLDLGSGNFTLEGQFRFLALPTGSNKAQLMGKWTESGNKRSYQLYKGGPSLESGNLVFRTSTNGQSGTVVEVVSWPWQPDLNRWYHIAVVRTSGETLLFVDGVQLGVPVVDVATYAAVSAAFGLGGEMANTTDVVANSAFDGFMDEIRITKGVARYTSEFIPPVAAFPRSVVDGDPDFLSVVLLCGFDNGIDDESSFGRALTAINGAVQNTPDDGAHAFQTINQHAPRDDTFIEAAFVAAMGTFTLSAVPSVNETVVIGSKTYTFKAVLSGANQVLIGATAEATLDNLIAAVTHGPGEGTTYGTGTTASTQVTAVALPGPQILVTALLAGTAGNAIATTDTTANGSWGAATLTGGLNIPGPSEFTFDHPPSDTTIIKSIVIINRSYKTDAGTCKIQVSFVAPEGGVAVGSEDTLTVNPTYREDLVEQDPDTMAGLTPSSLIGGRIRINRTA